MQKYHRISDEIEAEVVTKENAAELAHLCNGQVVEEMDPFDSNIVTSGINVPSLTGNFRVSEGEVLVKDRGGWTKTTQSSLANNFTAVD